MLHYWHETKEKRWQIFLAWQLIFRQLQWRSNLLSLLITPIIIVLITFTSNILQKPRPSFSHRNSLNSLLTGHWLQPYHRTTWTGNNKNSSATTLRPWPEIPRTRGHCWAATCYGKLRWGRSTSGSSSYFRHCGGTKLAKGLLTTNCQILQVYSCLSISKRRRPTCHTEAFLLSTASRTSSFHVWRN